MVQSNARPLDHLVLPVSSLETSIARYQALGFQISPIGYHPFGTKNACIWFQNETYLEPLAIHDQKTYQNSFEKGIPFITHDKRYRELLGPCGISTLAFSTIDAQSDYNNFGQKGYGAGRLFQFSRPGKTAEGEDCIYSFKGAFAVDSTVKHFCAFTLERHNVPSLENAPIARHPNGALGVTRIVLIAENPVDHAPYLNELTRITPKISSDYDSLNYDVNNAELSVLTPQQFSAELHYPALDPDDLVACAFEISVKQIATVESILQQNNIDHKRIETGEKEKLIISPADGQDFIMCFVTQ